MSDFGRRFDPSELQDGDPDPADASAAEFLVARDLEAFARSESVTPTIDFEDRVMAAIVLEPPPRAVGRGGVTGLAAAVRDAWRLTWSGGRPLAVRAQALALVLLAALALGSLGAVAAVGVSRILAPNTPPVAPTPLLNPAPSMRPSPSPLVSPSPSPTPSPTPTVDATNTAEPTQAARPTNGSGAGSGSGNDSSGPGSESGEASEPTQTPEPGDDSSSHDSGEDAPGSG